MSQLDLVPVLAPGVFMHRRSPTYLGFSHRGLFLELSNQPELHAVLATLMKSRTESKKNAPPSSLSLLAESCAISDDQLLEFLRPLVAEGFIFLQVPVADQYRTASVKSESLASRIKSEESISQWRSPGYSKEEILNRANF